MKKILIITFSLLFISFIKSIAQEAVNVRYRLCTTCNINNHDSDSVFVYNAPQDFNSSHVTSDYGPRDYGSDHYDWHGGIDYSTEGGDNDIGNGLVAIEAGTINTLHIGEAGYKYITFDGTDHNFGYGHIFTSENPQEPEDNYLKSGNFFIILIDGGVSDRSQDYAIITEDGRALYTTSSDTVTHPLSNVRIPTTNQVATNNLTVGPLGESIAVNRDVPAHLHLYLFEGDDHSTSDNNTKNPLQHVSHDTPEYNVETFIPREITHNHNHGQTNHDWARFSPQNHGVSIEYPGSTESEILVRARANNTANGITYNTDVLNIESFQINISSPVLGNVEQLIRGPFYESKLIYDGRANNQDSRYPTNLVLRGEANIGTTGIECWAYSDRRQRPWDYYHYADFVTRIHKDDPMDGNDSETMFADCPSEGRYPDGRYNLVSEVTDVRSSTFQSDSVQFILDNWKPYISEVTVSVGGTQLYHEEWTCNNGCISYSSNNTESTINSSTVEQGVTIFVKASEQLESLTLDVPAWNIDDLDFAPSISQLDSINFGFFISVNDISGFGTDVLLQFNGVDINENTLISFTADHEDMCLTVPHRDSDGWEDDNEPDLVYGIDSIHGFFIGCADSDSLKLGNGSSSRGPFGNTVVNILYDDITIQSEITKPQSGTCDLGSIDITIMNGEGPYDLRWSRIESPSVKILLFEVERVSGNDGQEDLPEIGPGLYEVIIEDSGCGILSRTFEVDCCIDIESLITETITADCDEDGSIVISWDDLPEPKSILWTDGNTSPIRTGLTHGQYEAEITMGDGCSLHREYTVEESTAIVYNGGIETHHPSSCTSSDGSLYMKFLSISGGSPPYSHIWSTGETGTVNNLSAGKYILIITDSNGCTNETDFFLEGHGQPSVFVSPVIHTCPEYDIGRIDITANALIGPLTITWSDGQEEYQGNGSFLYQKRENLAAGEYCYTVTDNATGCYAEGCRSVEIKELLYPLAVSAKKIQNTCNGDNGGYIELNISGGYGAKTIIWSTTGQSNLENVSAGTYSVTVTDECGSEVTKAYTIEDRTSNMSIDPEVVCVSDKTGIGSIDLNLTGDNGPFTIYWRNYKYTENITVTEPGTYTVNIIDVNGCRLEENIEVGTTPDDLSVEIRVSESTGCSDILDISGTAFVEGGVPPYEYEWIVYYGGNASNLTGQTIPFNGLVLDLDVGDVAAPKSRTYQVTVKDACGYIATDVLELNCSDICTENCFDFYHENPLSPPTCVDYCGSIDLECDQIELRPLCDDGIVRAVHWQQYNGRTIFEGVNRIFGKDDRDITAISPLSEVIYIINHTTGCITWKSVTIPSNECFNLWHWIGDNLNGGSGTTGGNSKTCEEWDINEDDCITFYDCPTNAEANYYEVNESETCLFGVLEENNYDGTLITSAYAEIEQCLKNCDHIGVPIWTLQPSVDVSLDLPDIPKCDDCIGSIISENCEEEVFSIFYNDTTEDFLVFSKHKKDSSSVGVVPFGNSPKNIRESYTRSYTRDVEFIDIVQVNQSEYISIQKDNAGFRHMRYDNIKDSISWTIIQQGGNYVSAFMQDQTIYLVTQNRSEKRLYTTWSYDRSGNSLGSEEITTDLIVYSSNDDAKISNTGSEYTIIGSRINTIFSLSEDIRVKGIFNISESKYGILYNEKLSQPANNHGGNTQSSDSTDVRENFTCGVMIYDHSNNNIVKYHLGQNPNGIITNFKVKGTKKVGISIGYNSNTLETDYLSYTQSDNLCIELVELNLSSLEDNISNRKVVSRKGLEREGFELSPNPTTDGVTLRFYSDKASIETISIFDVKGKLLYRLTDIKGQEQINLDLPNNHGVYIIEAQLDNGDVLRKQAVKI